MLRSVEDHSHVMKLHISQMTSSFKELNKYSIFPHTIWLILNNLSPLNVVAKNSSLYVSALLFNFSVADWKSQYACYLFLLKLSHNCIRKNPSHCFTNFALPSL